MFDPNLPYNDLPLVPPCAELETKETMRACLAANVNLAKLDAEAKHLPDPRVLVNSVSLLEAKSSSAIEGVHTTDEDLFRALADDGWSIKIGPGRTAAQHRLAGPDWLRELLAAAVDARRTARSGSRRTTAGESGPEQGSKKPRLGSGATPDGPLLRDDLPR